MCLLVLLGSQGIVVKCTDATIEPFFPYGHTEEMNAIFGVLESNRYVFALSSKVL